MRSSIFLISFEIRDEPKDTISSQITGEDRRSEQPARWHGRRAGDRRNRATVACEAIFDKTFWKKVLRGAGFSEDDVVRNARPPLGNFSLRSKLSMNPRVQIPAPLGNLYNRVIGAGGRI